MRSIVHVARCTIRSAVRLVAMVAALIVSVAATAHAHATLVSAEPAANSHAASGPARVRLVFSEPLEPTLARVELVAANGRVVRLAATGDPHDVHGVIAPLNALAPGAYRVAWRVVSADGHPVEGSYAFTVDGPARDSAIGHEPVNAAAPESALLVDTDTLHDSAPSAQTQVLGTPLVAAMLRALAVGSLMALAGMLAFLAWPGAKRDMYDVHDVNDMHDAARQRAMRVATRLSVGTPLLLAMHAVVWWHNVAPESTFSLSSISAAAATASGQTELRRIVLALLALWAVALTRRALLGLVFATGALVTSAMAGHPAAISPMYAEPAKAVHLLAGAAWLGGVLWLLALRSLIAGGEDRSAFRRQTERVSTVALYAAVLVAVSGVVQALLFLPAPLDLVRSRYGAVTLAKAVGTIGLVAFGAYYRRRIIPRLQNDGVPARFAAALAREAALFAVVILLGGFLAYVPPPARTAAEHSAHQLLQSSQ